MARHAICFSFLVMGAVIVHAASPPQREFARYQVILERRPFGEVVQPAAAPPPAPVAPPFTKSIKMSAIIEDEDGNLVGTRAVIDKDWAPGLLAQELKVDLFLISTAVPQVAINFNEPNQQWLDRMTAAEARTYHAEGHFKPGSMGPKMQAVISFLEAYPAGKALITDPPNIVRALDGASGTWVEAGE